MEKMVKRINNKEFFFPLALCRLAKIDFQLYGMCDQQSLRSACRLAEIESRYESSNYMVWATNKAPSQPAHMRSLTRAVASRLFLHDC